MSSIKGRLPLNHKQGHHGFVSGKVVTFPLIGDIVGWGTSGLQVLLTCMVWRYSSWGPAVFEWRGFGCRKWLDILSSSSAPWLLPSSLWSSLVWLAVWFMALGFLICSCPVPLKPSTTKLHRRRRNPWEFLTKYWPEIAQCHDTCVSTMHVWNHLPT